MDNIDAALWSKNHLWHPFTQMQDWEASAPLVIRDGHGIMLTGADGREYYDANSSLWVNIHGHRRPEIDAALHRQLDTLAHSTMLGLVHEPAAVLAKRLVEIAPEGLERVFYSDTGATAVEIALKMAFQYWQHRGQPERTRCIALTDGYHGDTLGAVSVGGIGLFHGIFHPLLFQAEFVESPSRFATAEEASAAIETVLEQHHNETFAIIVEPLIQGAGGMLVHPPGTLRAIRELCDRYDVLLIVDEVATGFGRTGTMFASDQENVSPDIMTLAKGLTGGYLPLAATLTTERIYSAFLGDFSELKTFFHGHSYTGNPLACTAAIASLDVFRDSQVIAGLPDKIELVRDRLAAIGQNAHVGSVRQCGLMTGIEIVRHKNPCVPYEWEQNVGARICIRARSLGLITRPLGNVVVFMPPLCSTAEELDDMLTIIETAINQEMLAFDND